MGNLFVFILYSFIYFVGYGWLIGYVFGYSPFMCFSSETKELRPLSVTSGSLTAGAIR